MPDLSGPLDVFLPGWLTRLDAPVSSRDPLGLQATAGQLADILLPGLNVFTSRARYYSFLCWALQETGGVLEGVHRLERLLVLCESIRHQGEPSEVCPFIGRRRGMRFVAEGPESHGWRLPSRILKNQTGNGALRLYRTSLVNVGLVSETDEGELVPVPRGELLAGRYGRKLDRAVIDWALQGGETSKRETTLRAIGDELCLSGRIDGHEKQHLLSALFGEESEHALRRRETTRVLFAHGLLAARGPGDVAAEDVDAVAEDGGRAAAAAQTQGNWAVLRASLSLPDHPDLRLVQEAAAYDCLALALNGVLSALIQVLAVEGRVGLDAMAARLSPDARASFGSLAGEPLRAADLVLAGEARALELLASVTTSARLRGLVDGVEHLPAPVLGALAIPHERPARAVARELLLDLVEQHRQVSVRKGKGEWLALEGEELVRRERYELPPLVHAMRFAQLQQIVLDLGLAAEELAHAA